MFDYEKLKRCCYKFKYETAIETDTERIQYGELLTRVNAVFNALLRLNTGGGTVFIFSRTSVNSLCCAYACNRAGFDCVIADSRLPLFDVADIVNRFSPSLCIAQGRELRRISKTLFENGCKSSVCTDTAPLCSILPTEYRLSELIEQNDYLVVNHIRERCPNTYFAFDDGVLVTDFSWMKKFARRDGLLVRLPFYKHAGVQTVTELLYDCHRLVITDTDDAKILKKKKIRALVTADTKPAFSGETVALEMSVLPMVGGGVYDCDRITETVRKIYKLPFSISLEDGKIRVSVTVDSDADMGRLQLYPPVMALKTLCRELLYPFDTSKTFAFTRK